MMRRLSFFKKLAFMLMMPGSALMAENASCAEHLNAYGACEPRFYYSLVFDPMAIKPIQSDTLFATSRSIPADDIAVVESSYIGPKWSFGFRASFNAHTCQAPLSLEADYFYWRQNVKGDLRLNGSTYSINSFSAPNPTIYPGLTSIFQALSDPFAAIYGADFIVLDNDNQVGSVSTSIDYNYNMLDLQTAWLFCSSRRLDVKLFGGFRGLWYQTTVNELNANSTGLYFSIAGDLSTGRDDFNAYGLSGGLSFDYAFSRCWHTHGWVGGSVLGGVNKQDFTISSRGALATLKSYRFQQSIPLAIYSIELGWNLLYDFCICQKQGVLGIGYEVIKWSESFPSPYAVNAVPTSVNPYIRGLFLEAISAKVGMSF